MNLSHFENSYTSSKQVLGDGNSSFSFFFFSVKKNLKGFLGKVERENCEESQNTKRIMKIHPPTSPIALQIAASRNDFNLLLRDAVKYKQCEKDFNS